jgi:hypothetical protein
MYRTFGIVLTVSGLLSATSLPADETADRIAEQKKTAVANWGLLDLGEPAMLETAHLLLYAPSSFEKRLKEWGPTLEKHYDLAKKALQIDEKDNKWWSGKLTVYGLAEREQFERFIRRIEKRRLESDEVGSYDVDNDAPHVVASPPRSKLDPPVEIQAAQQVASAMLQKKAGAKVPLPDWLVSGFGHATYYRALPSSATGAERHQAQVLVSKKKRTAANVWGSGLDVEEATVLRASLADYLAYGPGADKFPAFVAGFQPEENVERKTTEQALDAAGIKLDRLDKLWQTWVANPR